MAKNRMADRLLKDLGDQMGIATLEFDESDSCLLQFDEKTTVLVLYEQQENVIYLFSYVGELPKESDKLVPMLKALMGGNYRWMDSGGATLSTRPNENEVVLTRKMEVEALGIDKLKNAVSGFVLAQEKWQGALASGVAPQIAVPDKIEATGPSPILKA